MKSRSRRALIAGTALAGAWAFMAWRSGALLPADTAVVAAGDLAPNGFSSRKKTARLPSGDVAYLDEGSGPPIMLLHGCPFSAFEWRDIIPELEKRHRVIAPDLFGLGDTPVTLKDDYRLPRDVQMVRELLDHLELPRVDFVAHDHGGATLQLLMAAAPERIGHVVLSNVEAYDRWPSEPELPYLHAIVNPISSPIMFHVLQLETVQRRVFSIAVHRREVLTSDVLEGWTGPHIDSAARWQRLRRFFRWQLDAEHNHITMTAVDAMRAFEGPVLLLWGARDRNFGPPLAEQLARDIPGTRGIHWLENSAHMPMQEEPEEYARAVLAFFDEDVVAPAARAAMTTAHQSEVLR